MKNEANIEKKLYKNLIEKSEIKNTVHHPEVKHEADGRIITDPFGSWTGVPADNAFDMPVQDVDDL